MERAGKQKALAIRARGLAGRDTQRTGVSGRG